MAHPIKSVHASFLDGMELKCSEVQTQELSNIGNLSQVLCPLTLQKFQIMFVWKNNLTVIEHLFIMTFTTWQQWKIAITAPLLTAALFLAETGSLVFLYVPLCPSPVQNLQLTVSLIIGQF